MIKIALNGGMPKDMNPDLPVTVEEYSRELKALTEQGLKYFHIHFRDENGVDTLEEEKVFPQFTELKRRFNCQIGIGSPLLYGRTSGKRLEQISRWENFRPDYISVNVPEEGMDPLIALLEEKNVPMEIACFTMEDAWTFIEKGYDRYSHRVLIEVSGEKDGPATVKKAESIYECLHERYPDLEYILHGEDIYTWDVIRYAKERGLNWRIGMEDISCDENGRHMTSNLELYLHALEI